MEVFTLIIVIVAIYIVVRLVRKASKPPPPRFADRTWSKAKLPARTIPKRNKVELPRTVAGKAFVTDGDGLRVAGHEIRIAGIDAAEYDQRAKSSRTGRWFDEGWWAKKELIKAVGGRDVQVVVEDRDKFGRLIGQVICDGEDIGEWLVRNGYAIAAYSDQYKRVEQVARREKRGRWNFTKVHDPRSHRVWMREREDEGEE